MTREMVTPAPAAAPTRPPPSSTARRMKPRLDTALGGSESAGERAIVSAGRARSYHPFARDVHKKVRSPPSTGDGRSRPKRPPPDHLSAMPAGGLAEPLPGAEPGQAVRYRRRFRNGLAPTVPPAGQPSRLSRRPDVV